MRLPETPPQPPETNMVSYDTSFPLAYTEFEMLDTTTTLRLELSPTTIEMELEGLPQKYRTGYEISTLVFFERKQPQSTVYGDSLRKLLMKEAAKLNDGDDLESRLMPMMGYYTFFSVQDPTTKVSHYCPRQIPAVPPGLYRLQAYNGVKEFQKITPAKPYYETEIQVTGTEGKINVSIPF